LQAEKADLEKWSRSLEQTVNEKSALADGANSGMAELKTKLAQVQKQLDDSVAENRTLAARAAAAEQKLAVRTPAKPDTAALDDLGKQLAGAQQQAEKLTTDKQALADKVADEHRSFIQAQSRVAALERDLREARKPAANTAELEDLKGQLIASNQLLEKNGAALATLREENNRLIKAAGQKPAASPTEIADLKKQLVEANEALDKSSATVAELTGANDRLEKDLAAARQGSADTGTLRDELTKLRADAAAVVAVRAENTRLAKAAGELNDLRAKNDQLAKDAEQATAFMNGNRRDLNAAQARVTELEKQLADATTVRTRGGDDTRKQAAELADANATVEKLNATVAELTGANDRLEKDLDNARKSTAAALAAQSQAVTAAQPDAYKMEIGTLQARVKELEGQIEDERNNSAKEVSTLATQLSRTRETNKSLSEANRALMSAKQAEMPTVDKGEFDHLQERLRDLAAIGEDLKRQNEKLANDNQGLVGERATLQQQLADARKAVTVLPGLSDEKAALQERLEAVGAQLIKAQQDVDTLQKENADATSQALASKQAADKTQADLAALQGRATEAEKASESHNAAVAELTEANGKLETERNDLRRQLAAAKADNSRLTQTTGSLEQLKADADRSAQQNIAALTAQLGQLQRDLQSARGANSQLVEGNVAQERDRMAVITQLRNENNALVARLTQAQGTLDQIASAARLGTPAAAIAGGGTPVRPVVTTAATAEARIHIVVEGDSLSRISMRYYGTPNRWQEIYNANRDVLQASSTLRVGMQLRIP
jgi:chromosome segregation ATPase